MLLFAVDQAAGTKLLMRESWTVVQGIVVVLIAYTVGQLVASASSWLYEKLLVGRLLGYPRNILFGQPKAWFWVRRLMPSYFASLPGETQRAVLAKGRKVGVDQPGETLFWPAHVYGRGTPAVAARLDSFMNLYGFCRNVALVGLVNAAILYWSYLQSDGPAEHLLWARVSLLVSLGMTLRYLKFYRHFAIEVFTAWAFASDNEEPKA
ncbi:MAG: hypothetical protein LW860_00895 [Xanthomonadaceae bacterium]|jgi:hypothetical protein|nr:hypothetical protein [Xanthomonadaceae bacterium]